jgi:hypothetical protein
MPAAAGAGQLAEAEAANQPQEVPLLGPGVLEQPLRAGQPQPVRRLPDQPGGDPAPPVGLDDVEVADVGPAAQVGQAPALGQVGLDLDEADQLVERPDVRPLLGHAVHARGREGAVGVPVRHPPRPEPVQAGAISELAASAESGQWFASGQNSSQLIWAVPR